MVARIRAGSLIHSPSSRQGLIFISYIRDAVCRTMPACCQDTLNLLACRSPSVEAPGDAPG